VFLGELSVQSANYIAGYVVKKLTSWWDESLQGRAPEFARMSRKPGIGVTAMDAVAESMLAYRGKIELNDVPATLRHGKAEHPLGRFLRRKLRELNGLDPNVPKEVQLQAAREMLPVQALAVTTGKSQKEIVVEVSKGQVAKSKAKADIFKKRGSI